MARDDRVLALYRRPSTPELHTEIRELYKAHSIAEDERRIDGLLATLTTDCVYELPQYGARWEGHDGAARFYTELLGAFPDIVFDLRNVVIGPQGVFEEADVSATWRGPWQGAAPTGEPVEFRVLILFPWDDEQRRFSGERVYLDDPSRLGRSADRPV
jgi:predicted ester cyclase